MRLDLDPSYLHFCMKLWRESVRLQIPMMGDDFRKSISWWSRMAAMQRLPTVETDSATVR